VIRIDAIWLATTPMDMRAGTDTALARIVSVFGAAHPHTASEVRHLFAKIPVFVPRPANEFKYLPQFSGSKQKMSVVARCVF
jgi:hypothetical protein